MNKNLLALLIIASGFPAYAVEGEEFFHFAKEVIAQMERDSELEGKTKHQAMREMLATKDLSYECNGINFDEIIYDDCVTFRDVARLPDDRLGGFLGGMAGAAATRVAERVYDRVIDRGLDRVERKAETVKKEIEASDRRERESRARENERSKRCSHSVPSYREGDCA